ncbi:hypothetical protein JOJ88_002791 [Pantoea cypripedii]|nr:hypothetical protein [Pantoea cypripedii]
MRSGAIYRAPFKTRTINRAATVLHQVDCRPGLLFLSHQRRNAHNHIHRLRHHVQ